jgi:pimeloyl-ACP methyl ester carboxylesterase
MRPLYLSTNIAAKSDDDWAEYKRTVSLDHGERISFVDIGDGPGPVLLLIHGLGGSWQAWLANIRPLAEAYRVVAVDLPGFGASPLVPGCFTFSAYARVMDRFCDCLGIDSVVAVGNSFGGWVTVDLAIRRPDLVAGIVLVDAAGIPPTRRERWKVVTMLRVADRAAPLACRYRDAIVHDIGIRKKALSFALARPENVPAEIVAGLLPERPSPAFRPVLSAAVRSWSLAWCDRVAEIRTPALVLWGELDAQLPLRHAHEWTRLLSGSELVVIPDAGHLPMLEQPDIVNGAVTDFLTRASAASSLAT